MAFAFTTICPLAGAGMSSDSEMSCSPSFSTKANVDAVNCAVAKVVVGSLSSLQPAAIASKPVNTNTRGKSSALGKVFIWGVGGLHPSWR